MKKIVRYLSVMIIAVFGSVMMMSVAAPSALAESTTDAMQKGYNAAGGDNNKGKTGDLALLIRDIVNILLYILGAIAVIMIIIGGLKYTTSNGDQSQVTSAKNTIMYAAIGLIVAIMAYAIVNFVITSFK